jgi:hypothetical protein
MHVRVDQAGDYVLSCNVEIDGSLRNRRVIFEHRRNSTVANDDGRVRARWSSQAVDERYSAKQCRA